VNPRREFAAVVAAVVVGAALVLLASTQVWLVEVQPRPAPLPPVEVSRTGGALVPAVPALALVALAGAGGLIATRGVARAAVGVLLALAGVAELILLAGHLGSGWAVLGLVGALLVAAGGAATLWHGGRWPAMGSRYTRAASGPAEAAGPSVGDTAMWDALDRGEDPTDRHDRT
jgi:hypothetical protein